MDTKEDGTSGTRPQKTPAVNPTQLSPVTVIVGALGAGLEDSLSFEEVRGRPVPRYLWRAKSLHRITPSCQGIGDVGSSLLSA
ncbi:MAG: hypothetical protein PHN90_04435 [Methanothrix sp.]|nr:hypothetical protein [Methanothrix sp.]